MITDADKEKDIVLTVVNEIPDETIREWTKIMFENAPQGYWSVPASSSGRYHPPDERETGGTFRHSIRAFYIMQELCLSLQNKYNDRELSMMMSAILLHDICNEFGRGHEEAVRPYYESIGLKEHIDKQPEIMNMIERHMGRWGRTPPQTDFEWIVHYADNIASKTHNILTANGRLSSVL